MTSPDLRQSEETKREGRLVLGIILLALAGATVASGLLVPAVLTVLGGAGGKILFGGALVEGVGAGLSFLGARRRSRRNGAS